MLESQKSANSNYLELTIKESTVFLCPLYVTFGKSGNVVEQSSRISMTSVLFIRLPMPLLIPVVTIIFVNPNKIVMKQNLSMFYEYKKFI